MRLSFACIGILAALLGLDACMSHDEAGPDIPPTPPPSDQSTIRFEHEGTIALGPGETREITVIASPPGPYEVNVGLLGDALDAWIEKAILRVDRDGRAKVVLHAPTQSTTFQLRASLLLADGSSGANAIAGVAVSDQGFGTLRVIPVYKGKRPVSEWTASVVARTSCKDIADLLPGEPPGALLATASGSEMPVIQDAPVGPNLAVAIRAGHYVHGCTDLATLKAGETLDVTVMAVDVPVALEATHLELSFAYAPKPSDYATLLTSTTGLVTTTFGPTSDSDEKILLDAMSAHLSSSADAQAFADARANASWDMLAAQHLSGTGVAIRDQIAAWAALGLDAQAPVIEATLDAKTNTPDIGTLVISKLGSVPASDAGIPQAIPVSWTADPDDRLLLGGNVLWEPSRFVCAAATSAAAQEISGASTMADALGQKIDCAGLGATLIGFGNCDPSCMTQLCHDALDDRWLAAREASVVAAQIGSITITATGQAELNDTAEPIGYSGLWVGTVTAGNSVVQVNGQVSGMNP